MVVVLRQKQGAPPNRTNTKPGSLRSAPDIIRRLRFQPAFSVTARAGSVTRRSTDPVPRPTCGTTRWWSDLPDRSSRITDLLRLGSLNEPECCRCQPFRKADIYGKM